MNNKNCSSVRRPAYTRLAFTLVELIVVITILAILGTIAFISLQGYSSQARDSKRLSDISNIKKSLELFSLNTGKYPIPDDDFTVSYSGEILRYQGIVGEQVSTNLSRNLNEKPVDPLTAVEYTYSTTHSKTEYEVLGLYESDLISTSPLFFAKATKSRQPSPLRGEGARTLFFSSSNAETQDYPKIDGNYNGIYVKTSSFYVPTPSIINAEIVVNDDLDSDNIKSQIISGGDNLAGISTGGLDINFSYYEGTITENSTDEEKTALVEVIQTVYSGSQLASNTMYVDILSRTSTGEMVDFVDIVVLNKDNFVNNNSSSNNTCESGYAWNGTDCISLVSFVKTLGGASGSEYIYSVASDTNGNIYVGGMYMGNVTDFSGNTLNGTNHDGFVAKLDTNGNQVWIKRIGGSGSDYVTGLSIDTYGNIYVGGYYRNDLSNTSNVVDFSGTSLSGVTSLSSSDGFVVKLDTNGNQTWIKTFGGTGFDYINGLSTDTNGNIYIGGSYKNNFSNAGNVFDFSGVGLNGKSSSLSDDGFVVKLDTNGNQQWIKTFGGTEDENIKVLSTDVNGNIYIGGSYVNNLSNTNNVVDFLGTILNGKSSTSSDDLFVTKFDTNGNQQWIKTFGGIWDDNTINGLSTDINGNVSIGGSYVNNLSNTNNVVDFLGVTLYGYSSSLTHDGFVVKFDTNGNQQWIKTFGGKSTDHVYSVFNNTSGDIYVGGTYVNNLSNLGNVFDFSGSILNGYSSSSSSDGFIAKLDINGNQQFIKTFGGEQSEFVECLLTDSSGNIYVGGSYQNDLSNTNNVVDFSGSTLSGVTDSLTVDACLIKVVE